MAKRKSEQLMFKGISQETINHRTTPEFWSGYRALPTDVRLRADKQFSLLKANPQHPSLHFKKLHERRGKEIFSARITLDYRAMAFKLPHTYLWFWIGPHKAYDGLIS